MLKFEQLDDNEVIDLFDASNLENLPDDGEIYKLDIPYDTWKKWSKGDYLAITTIPDYNLVDEIDFLGMIFYLQDFSDNVEEPEFGTYRDFIEACDLIEIWNEKGDICTVYFYYIDDYNEEENIYDIPKEYL